MPRPKPDPHPIEPWLRAKGLRTLSVLNYAGIVRRIERDALGDAEKWLNQAIVVEKTPKRTLTVWRCAAKYYMEWKGTSWQGPRPALNVQPDGKDRTGLDPGEQLAAYYEEAEKQAEPYRTILLLLPRTGLRCFEICALTEDSYDRNVPALDVLGKRGRPRSVPLTKVAQHTLDLFLAAFPRNPDGLLFWTIPQTLCARARPVTTRDVRAVTWKISRGRKSVLWDLSPHMLRHTVASELLNEGVSLKVIQDILGHKSIRSLDPYLHPSKRSLRDAMEKLK